MRKALVTGAAGFIGSHVVRELLDEGVEVRALIRPGENTDNLKGLDCEWVMGDVLDRRAVDKAMQAVDTLFHLAAIYVIWLRDWSRIYEVNIQGSRNVLWAARRAGVGRVVYTSSIAAVGVAPGMSPADECTSFNQYTLGNHYVITKYLSQQEALSFAAEGMDLVVVNPAFPFGPRDIAPTPTGQIIIDILRGLNRFYFAGGINIVDVRDVAKGHVLAARKGRAGELYILGNRNVSMHEFMQLVYRTAGISESFLPRVPISALKGVLPLLVWWADHVSHKPPLSTPADMAYASQYLFFDNRKAREELGLSLTPIEQSLADSVAWFRSHGYA